jgi:hypothetical protein
MLKASTLELGDLVDIRGDLQTAHRPHRMIMQEVSGGGSFMVRERAWHQCVNQFARLQHLHALPTQMITHWIGTFRSKYISTFVLVYRFIIPPIPSEIHLHPSDLFHHLIPLATWQLPGQPGECRTPSVAYPTPNSNIGPMMTITIVSA